MPMACDGLHPGHALLHLGLETTGSQPPFHLHPLARQQPGLRRRRRGLGRYHGACWRQQMVPIGGAKVGKTNELEVSELPVARLGPPAGRHASLPWASSHAQSSVVRMVPNETCRRRGQNREHMGAQLPRARRQPGLPVAEIPHSHLDSPNCFGNLCVPKSSNLGGRVAAGLTEAGYCSSATIGQTGYSSNSMDAIPLCFGDGSALRKNPGDYS